ncbi:MAG TPA: hypothetical protein PKY96_14475 [Flavobacteriales bacterium]|nr:hypothetical protein [Flavobacteriales bacterium]
MDGPALGLVAVLLLGSGIGAIPLVLLFLDYRKRHQIHKPLIFLAAFGFTFAVLLPFMLKSLGIWIVLAVPLALFAMVITTRKASRE